MNNRITAAFVKMEKQIADKGHSTEKLAEVSKSLDMEADEHARFQSLKTVLVGVVITLDEGSTLYHHLGESVNTFNKQPVHIKAVLTQVFQELLKYSLAARNG